MKAQKIADGSYRGVYRGVEFGFRLSGVAYSSRHALIRKSHKWYGWSYLRDGYIDLFRPTKQGVLVYLKAQIDSYLGESVEDS